MLRNDAVELIKQGLGFRTGTAIDANIIRTMKHVQWKLEHGALLPWFLVSEILTISTVIGEPRVLVPNGFLREIDEGALWRFEATAAGTWTELIKKNFDFLQRKQQGTGAPAFYSLLGRYFRLFPAPAAVYPLKVVCYLQDTLLDTNIQNKWLEHAEDLMIANTGMMLSGDLVNRVAMARFQGEAAAAAARYVVENEAREHANRQYVVGGEG